MQAACQHVKATCRLSTADDRVAHFDTRPFGSPEHDVMSMVHIEPALDRFVRCNGGYHKFHYPK
jgi:hypothetical protein